MGTPEFAVPALSALQPLHDVVAVFSQPDRPSGRGRSVKATPVAAAAHAWGLTVHQPGSLREADVAVQLATLDPDLIVVAAYGAILPAGILEVPRIGSVNIHASLLPRWRGAAPIQRAILAGDATTGVCIMRMEAGLDTGPWCARCETAVDEKYAADLTAELAEAGADLLIASLPAVAAGTATWHEQDESLAVYAAKVSAVDVALAPGLGVVEAFARVRASGPSAPCRAVVGGRTVTVIEARQCREPVAPGEARCSDNLVLGLSDGSLEVTRVVPEGRSLMSGADFVRGARLGGRCSWTAR